MAIGSATHWNCRSTATAANVNGGGFNIGNTNFPTDYTATAANTASPVLSSASYNFVANDVGHWVYVKAGTNWTPGWYQIASVASNNATLNAAVGAATILLGTAGWGLSTVAGCATVASPTGGTVGIDYSQSDAAAFADTDLACADGDAAAPTVTSAAKPFGVNHVGNIIHILAGTGYTTLKAWYEIVSVSGVTATLDRAVGTDGAKTNGTFKVGGSISLGSSTADSTDLNFTNTGVAGNTIWIKNTGTYTLGVAITSMANGTQSAPYTTRGYNLVRADNPKTKTTQPKIVGAWYFGSSFQHVRNLYLYCDVTGNNGIDGGGYMIHNTIINTYVSATSACFCSSNATLVGNEIVCLYGQAVTPNTSPIHLYDNYIHHSVNGVSSSSTGSQAFIGNIFESISGTCILLSGAVQIMSVIRNNTFYGGATPFGTGINYSSATAYNYSITNNMFYGLATGITCNSLTRHCLIDYNNFFNNTADLGANLSKGSGDTATTPSFASVAEYTGSTATSSGSVLTDSGAAFTNVVAGRDYVYVSASTGGNTGMFDISSKTATTITSTNTFGTGTGITYRVIYGHDYTPGTAFKAAALPSFMNQTSISYLDTGAVQRKEKTSTDPGIANVKSGTNYTIDDAPLTGTLSTGGGGGSSGNGLGNPRIG